MRKTVELYQGVLATNDAAVDSNRLRCTGPCEEAGLQENDPREHPPVRRFARLAVQAASRRGARGSGATSQPYGKACARSTPCANGDEEGNGSSGTKVVVADEDTAYSIGGEVSGGGRTVIRQIESLNNKHTRVLR